MRSIVHRVAAAADTSPKPDGIPPSDLRFSTVRRFCMSDRSPRDPTLHLDVSVPAGWSIGRLVLSTASQPDAFAETYLFLVAAQVTDFAAAVRAAVEEWRSSGGWTEHRLPTWGNAVGHLPLDGWFKHGLVPLRLPAAHELRVDRDDTFITRAEAFFERYWAARARREAAVSHRVTEPLRDAGYEISDTGGGCLAWFRPLTPDGGDHLLITSNNDIDGDPGKQVWEIGRYSDNGWVSVDESFTLREAIRNAALLPPPSDKPGQLEGTFPTVAAARAALLGEKVDDA